MRRLVDKERNKPIELDKCNHRVLARILGRQRSGIGVAHKSGMWAWHVGVACATGLGEWFRIPFVNRWLLLYC